MIKNSKKLYAKLGSMYQSSFDKSNGMQPWFIKANQLYLSANVILEKYNSCQKIFWDQQPTDKIAHHLTPSQIEAKRYFEINDSYLLLCGFAFENLLKGIIISKNNCQIENGKFNNNILNTHDVLELYENAKINTSKSEKIMATRLKEAVVWASRYPVPKNKENMRLINHQINIKCIPGAYFDGDEKVINIMWNNLIQVIKSDPQIEVTWVMAALCPDFE